MANQLFKNKFLLVELLKRIDRLSIQLHAQTHGQSNLAVKISIHTSNLNRFLCLVSRIAWGFWSAHVYNFLGNPIWLEKVILPTHWEVSAPFSMSFYKIITFSQNLVDCVLAPTVYAVWYGDNIYCINVLHPRGSPFISLYTDSDVF